MSDNQGAADLAKEVKNAFETQKDHLRAAVDESLAGPAGKELTESIMQGVAKGIPAGMEFGIKELASHKPCGEDGCELCKIRSEISAGGFRRGVNEGIKLSKKFPGLVPE